MKLTRRKFTAGVLAAPALLRAANAALPPLPNIAPGDATFVPPGSALYDTTLPAYNLRTELRPALRILVRTARGMRQAVDWLRDKNVAFALRSGGHSFEGFSQSTGVVLDTRLMNAVSFDADTQILSVGAGAALGSIYRMVAPRGFAFSGGSCPTVGVSGHVLGGGFGLIARERGLACDSLTDIDLIDADAREIRANAEQNSDLFWACRGGGGGTFGAATALRFKLYPVGSIAVYAATWALPPDPAARLFQVWQDWAPRRPDAITGFLKLSRRGDGRIVLHLSGQSMGSPAELHRELKTLTDTAKPVTDPTVTAMSYMGAVNHFSGGWSYDSGYSKGKSDYITKPLDAAGAEALLGGLAALPPNEIVAICDPYGGAVSRPADDATAFAYRAGTLFCIQYYTGWTRQAAAPQRL